jgi:hypothetical protein
VTSTEFTDRLREEMRHATAGVPAPSGLVRKVRRSLRRRVVMRTTAAGLAAAVAGVAAGVTVSGTPQRPVVYTTAYVVKHVESALNAADDIAYLHGTSGRNLWLYDGPRGQASRVEVFKSDGQLAAENGSMVTSAGAETDVHVDFPARTWWRQTFPSSGLQPAPKGCGFSLPITLNTFPELAAQIRHDFACGALTDQGSRYVDGVNALELVSVQHVHVSPARVDTVTVTVWVNPASYLPVRWSITSSGGIFVRETYDIRWLPPTSANLALLSVPIPPGFTQTHPLG